MKKYILPLLLATAFSAHAMEVENIDKKREGNDREETTKEKLKRDASEKDFELALLACKFILGGMSIQELVQQPDPLEVIEADKNSPILTSVMKAGMKLESLLNQNKKLDQEVLGLLRNHVPEQKVIEDLQPRMSGQEIQDSIDSVRARSTLLFYFSLREK